MYYLNKIKKFIDTLYKGNTVNETQKALFRFLMKYGKEINRRLERESYAIDLKIASLEQTIKLYEIFPIGGPVTEEEKTTEISRSKKLLPGLKKDKEEKAKEIEEFLLTYENTQKAIIQTHPGIDKGGA